MSHRSKPVVSIRRPSKPTPTQVESFIQSGTVEANVQTSRRPDAQTSKEARRRTTVYFEPETIRLLKLHCVQQGVEMSATVNEAVRRFLGE